MDTTIICEDKRTPVKNSYVYGDSNRKILTSRTKMETSGNSGNKEVREWRFGELIESRQSGLNKEINQSKIGEEKTKDE